jgi:hypothetical protein
MHNAKYVSFQTSMGEIIVLFPAMLQHRDVAYGIKKTDASAKVLGAGFVKFRANGEAYCYGSSDSLKIGKHDTMDDILLRILLKKEEY